MRVRPMFVYVSAVQGGGTPLVCSWTESKVIEDGC